MHYLTVIHNHFADAIRTPSSQYLKSFYCVQYVRTPAAAPAPLQRTGGPDGGDLCKVHWGRGLWRPVAAPPAAAAAAVAAAADAGPAQKMRTSISIRLEPI